MVVFVITATSNAVNLTDGLDGLAIGTVGIVGLTLAVISYISGNTMLSEYLTIPFLRGNGELAVFCAALVGAALGFLWFNAYPAQVFMGDTGSLALGGAHRCALRADQERAAAADPRRGVSGGDGVGDHPAALFQVSRSGSTAKAGGCSGWRRCTTISRCSDGRSRRS